MRWGYVGNFEPDHSTENEVAKGLEENGHEVVRLQENQPATWETLRPASLLEAEGMFDVLLWTRTGWDWPRTACGWTHGEADAIQRAALASMRSLGIPTVGYHLDRWWGLNREGQVREEPFFRVDLLVTADGGHDELWEAEGVRHHWMPPGVSHLECGGGTHRPELAGDVAFVGSWRPGYHREWAHRPTLIRFLQQNYRRQLRLWPQARRPAVRGEQLRDLYTSTKVLVGDSCLVNSSSRYWSDRIPETLGRGGFLLHPYVEGIEEHFTDGKHLRLWPLGDWSELRRLIDYYLAHDEERTAIAEEGRRHVLENHTYAVRMAQLEQLLRDESML